MPSSTNSCCPTKFSPPSTALMGLKNGFGHKTELRPTRPMSRKPTFWASSDQRDSGPKNFGLQTLQTWIPLIIFCGVPWRTRPARSTNPMWMPSRHPWRRSGTPFPPLPWGRSAPGSGPGWSDVSTQRAEFFKNRNLITKETSFV